MINQATKTHKVRSSAPTQVVASVSSATPVPAGQFGEIKLPLRTMAQVLLSQQNNQRRSTANTKRRGEVSGSTRKPWRQKGTGRARVGTRRSPIWRGGGIVFGPTKQRNWGRKINRELKTSVLLGVLASKAGAGEVWQIASLPAVPPKTRELLAILGGHLDPSSNLLVAAEVQPALKIATRNLSYVKLTTTRQLDALSAAKARRIIFLPGALEQLQARIG